MSAASHIPPMALVGIARLCDWEGLDAAPLRAAPIGRLAAVLAPAAAGRAHHAHVVAACRIGALLPARAGQGWDARCGAAWRDDASQSAAMAALALVEGAVEITLHVWVAAPADDVDAACHGRTYLRQRQAAHARAAAAEARVARISGAVVAAMEGRCRRLAQTPAAAPGRIGMILAMLVPRADAPALAGMIEALAQAEAMPDMHVRVDGPWPPYHFADIPLAGAGALAA